MKIRNCYCLVYLTFKDKLKQKKIMKTKNLLIIGGSVLVAGIITFLGIKKCKKQKPQDNNQEEESN